MIFSHSLQENRILSLVVLRNVFVLQVVSVNPADKAVKLSDGTLQRYDQLLISTGCRLESSSCSSNHKQNIFRLFWHTLVS